MIVTVNWGTKVVIVPRSEMLLVQSTPVEIRQLDLTDFRFALHDVQDSEVGIVYPHIHNHNPSVTVAGTALAKVIEIINGYTITFEDGLYNVNIVGGNSNVADRVNKNQVGVNTANSAGLQDSSSLQAASFGDVVAIDQINGINGTTFPIGTKGSPCKTIDNARSIMLKNNIGTIYPIGNLTLGVGDDVSNIIVRGQNPTKTIITIGTEANTTGCEIRECTVIGVLDGGTVLRQCLISTIVYFNGFCVDCVIAEGTITLGGGASALFLSCVSGVAGSNMPTINMGGSGQSLGMRDYNGGLRITNKTGIDSVSLDMSSGQVVVESSVTNTENIAVRGIARLTDLSIGVNKIDSVGLLSGERTVRGSGYVVVAPNGYSGTDTRTGTATFPSNNLTDAVVIAKVNGVNKIRLQGNITTIGTENLSSLTLDSESAVVSSLTITTGTITTNSTFRELNVIGGLSGDGAILERCVVGNLTGAKGFIYNCFLYGTITVSGDTTVAQCSVAVNAPSRKALLDFNGVPCTILTSGWASGVLGLKGMVTGAFAGVSGTGGRVAIELGNTGGELVYSGSIMLNTGNESTLTSITDASVAGIIFSRGASTKTLGEIADSVWGNSKAVTKGDVYAAPFLR